MKAEREFDLVAFVRILDKQEIPYLLIGRWAVILHGAPLMTADYDFWIDPESKDQLLGFLVKDGYEVPPQSEWKEPLISVFLGIDKIDFLFVRSITNREGRKIRFQDCYKRSDIIKDSRRKIEIHVPSINDLIALKRISRTHPQDALKDEVDIRFLEAIKRKT